MANELRVGSGLIPENAGGIPWWFLPDIGLQYDSDPSDSMVRLELWNGSAFESVGFVIEALEFADLAASGEHAGGFLIRPELPWVEGERYRVATDIGSLREPESRFRMVEFNVVAPLAETGHLQLRSDEVRRDELTLFDGRGGCASSHEAAFVRVWANPSAPIEGWPGGIMHWTTFVDDAPWYPTEAVCSFVEPGTSWIGRGSDQVVAACDGHKSSSVTMGTHRVRMEARLPGSTLTYVSDEVLVDLNCSAAFEAAADAAPPIEVADAGESAPVAPATETTPATAATGRDVRQSVPLIRSTSCSTPRWPDSRNAPWAVLCAMTGLGLRRRFRRPH